MRERAREREKKRKISNARERMAHTDLAYSDDTGREDEHSDCHPGDVGFEPPRLGKVAPAIKLARGHLRP